jgi:arylsulfatase A-like enzyme
MYEESIRMPFLIRYPREIKPGSVTEAMALNVDFAPTILDFAGVRIPKDMQGRSLRLLFNGTIPMGWRTSVYYRYWMHLDKYHNVYSHYGIRTHRYKLIYYYAQALGTSGSKEETRPPEWELFDLKNDPYEIKNLFTNPEYSNIVTLLKAEMKRLQQELLDEPVYET